MHITLFLLLRNKKNFSNLFGMTSFTNLLPSQWGLSSSPTIFTKVMKPVLASLRKKGHINSGFIDDFYFQGQQMSDCVLNISDTLTLFISLGLHVHPDKCVLTPSQEILMLGFSSIAY